MTHLSLSNPTTYILHIYDHGIEPDLPPSLFRLQIKLGLKTKFTSPTPGGGEKKANDGMVGMEGMVGKDVAVAINFRHSGNRWYGGKGCGLWWQHWLRQRWYGRQNWHWQCGQQMTNYIARLGACDAENARLSALTWPREAIIEGK
ncbi:hypothetical protein Acr_00g0074090 [Actinidia rufa]|uniref:Uncharacterized protein n=1 Tax=Actinidia rufa TaxID=165716 RepID=A0A7J0DSA6_9ERIC|nr:hypothetical protein Acr_00g0074090 [Actinidia rufa]